MINFRIANKIDAPAIAALHAESWQKHYRNVLSEKYLNGPILQERLEVWTKRLNHPKAEQYILIAEENNKLLGFACFYFKEDPKWGTLLDNLHVTFEKKGQGIGRQLWSKGLQWSFEKEANVPVHLWVFEMNTVAIAAYESWGGQCVEKAIHHNPDRTSAQALRYVWQKENIN